jgi:hypothetical protein
MEYIAKYYNPISLTEALQILYSDKNFPKNSILITFDDGYDDNYKIAYPILKEHGIPATFFITTNFIDKKTPLWFETLCFLINRCNGEELKNFLIELGFINERPVNNRQLLYQRVVEHIKLCRVSNVIPLIEHYLANNSRLKAEFKNYKRLVQPMTWNQVKEMSSNGMEFGSHSDNHLVLANETNEVIYAELNNSKMIIEQKLNKPCTALAYPVGQASSISDDVVNLVQKIGFKLAFTYINGSSVDDLFRISRNHIDCDMSFSFFKARLQWPNHV